MELTVSKQPLEVRIKRYLRSKLTAQEFAEIYHEAWPPAYLRKPERKRWRGLIRAALGPKYSTGWEYRIAVAHRLDPIMCRSGNIWNGIGDALWNER